MLDGIFTLFSMGMTGLGSSPPTWLPALRRRFQYGYAHFEPIANVINGAIILLFCLGAPHGGITSPLAGGRK